MCLRIIHKDKQLSSNAPLEKDGSVSIHERNIETLATEIFKVSKNVPPLRMHEIFKLNSELHYNLKYNFLFSRPLVESVCKGTKSLSFLGSKI